MANSLYIAGIEPGSGKSVVALGVMEFLSRRVRNVGYFRPIISSTEQKDNNIQLILDRYDIDLSYEEMFAYTHDEAQALVADGHSRTMLKNILERFRHLQRKCGFVLCEGTDFAGVSSAFEFDINADVAANLGSPILLLVNGMNKTPHQAGRAGRLACESFESRGCTVAAAIINRVVVGSHEAILRQCSDAFVKKHPIYILPETDILGRPTIEDITRLLNAEKLQGGDEGMHRSIYDYKVAAMKIPNFLDFISDGDLVITPGDRSDVILASLASVVSDTYPNISGLLLTGGLKPEPQVVKLLEGFSPTIPIPILSVKTDTFTTAVEAGKVRAALRPGDERKIAAALGVFEANVDIKALEDRIDIVRSTRVTPIMFEYELIERAKKNTRRIVLAEGEEPRILRAAEILMRRRVAEITLLGGSDIIQSKAGQLGLNLDGVKIIDPVASDLRERLAKTYYELRRHRGLSREMAWDAVANVSNFGTLMVKEGFAHGMVSGAVHTTRDTIRPAFQIIKTRPDVSLVSSVFFMCLPGRVLVYGDCAVNPNPDARQLADIAVSAAETAKMFGLEPRVAMCSYSTGASGVGQDVDKVREATRMVKNRFPALKIDGPIQYDAAVDAGVAKTKMPDSEVAGKATVFIFPDLNTGNNLYKAVQRSAGAVAVGPVLQGLNKPVNDLSRGCTVTDIVNTVAITVIQAR